LEAWIHAHALDEEDAAGEKTVLWDCRDGRGDILPPGVYTIAVSRAGSRQSAAAIIMGE